MLTYVEPTDISKGEFAQIIESGTIESKCDAIVRAVNFISDYDWLLSQFINLVSHPDEQVRGVTVTCIGHMARLYDQSSKQDLLKILQPLLLDEQN